MLGTAPRGCRDVVVPLRQTLKYEATLPQTVEMAEAGSGIDLILRALGIGAEVVRDALHLHQTGQRPPGQVDGRRGQNRQPGQPFVPRYKQIAAEVDRRRKAGEGFDRLARETKVSGGTVLRAYDFANRDEAAAAFTSMAGGPIDWRAEDDVLVVTQSSRHANHLVSKATFRDADIHAEFVVVPEAKGNSGLYLHGHYEMRIYDSFGVMPVTEQDEGSLYRFAKPIVNAARPAGEWQVYDIRFIAPRRDTTDGIVRPGRVTAWLNGHLVQNGLAFTEPRWPYTPYKHRVTDHLRGIERELLATGKGPLFLQDHGSPPRYRNVWIRPLGRP